MKVLLVHVTGLHLGYVGCYGNDWVSTPALDWLAAEGVVFDQHYADTLGDWPSHWTGRYRFPWLHKKQPPAPPDLAGLLQENGVGVIQITEAQFLASGHINPASYHGEVVQHLGAALDSLQGQARWLITLELPSLLPPWLVGEDLLAHYFLPDAAPAFGKEDEQDPDEEDISDQEEELIEEEEATEALEEDIEDNEAVTDEMAAAGAAEEEMLMPLLEPPHGAIDVDDDTLAQRLQLTYAAVMSQMDSYLQTALEQLRSRGLLDDVLIIVTADRGVALGEHGAVGDVPAALHEELIHLPLLFRLPGSVQAGRRVAALTQPVDLFPTLLEAYNVAAPAHHGHSLHPFLRGPAAPVRDYACAGARTEGGTAWTLRTPEWALLLTDNENEPRPPQMFAKPEDRWEVNEVRQPNIDLAEHLEQTLRAWVKSVVANGPLQPPPLEQPEENRPEEAS